MIGFSPLELVALAVVALGVFSVLGVVAFKVFEGLLEPKRWQADQVGSGERTSTDEMELMRSHRGSLGDRITAVERRLPGLKKPLEGDPVDKLLASLPDVEGLPPIRRGPVPPISSPSAEEEE